MVRRFVLKPEAEAPRTRLTVDYAGQLNPQQYAVVTAGGGPILVVAGAGTGKTRTLVYRVAYLVETGTPPEEIVLLTFTRRAAREMLARAAALLDGRCERVQGGTFHAFCLGLLRRHAGRLGYPSNFTVLDAADAADVIDLLRTAHGYHRIGRRFPRKQAIQALFSAVANHPDADLETILALRYPQFLAHLEALETLRADYIRYKRQHGLMDYDDLLACSIELLTQHPDVHRQVAARCRYVLVDEYQDTNHLQAQITQHLAAVHGNVMAVGDDAQSIYRFRGADFRNIFAFPKLFPGTRILKLEQNYRSTQPILDLANRIIQRAHYRYEKVLFSERKQGERPAIVPAPDERTESRFVCQMILTLREQGVPLHQIAVLFRNSYNAFELELELNRRGIPYVKYGGLKLSEAAHVKDLLAYLRLLENPKDAAAWNRVLQLIEGIGPRTAQRFIAWITSADATPFVLEERPFSPRYAEALIQLFTLLRQLKEAEWPLEAQMTALLHYYRPLCERRYYEDYPRRLQDLEHLVGLSARFQSRRAFLEALVLDPLELTALAVEPLVEDEPPLVLSTIHSAKGLEFHTVFLIHALEGILPSAYALNEPEALDEELRLLYVAITRAREYLFITYPMIRYQAGVGPYLTSPSRFLENLPEEILEPWTLVEEPLASSVHEPPRTDVSALPPGD